MVKTKFGEIMTTNIETTEAVNPVIKRGKVDSLTLYEVTENELELLENGSPSSLYLNFSIFLLSTSITTLSSLFTCDFKNEMCKTTFIVVTVVGIILGIFLLLLWNRTRTSIKENIKKIKGRVK